MRVKIEVELEITTDWKEIEGCTEENFKEHIIFVLKDSFMADSRGDLDYVSVINKIEFLN